jgi:hypothetical protein
MIDDEDFDLYEDDDSSDTEKGLATYVKKKTKAFVRNFVDYGPPYKNAAL